MNPIEFPQQTGKLGKGQPQYRVLPIAINQTDSESIYQYTCKYELTELELAQISQSKCFYFSQYGSCFHPIRPQVETPFGVCNITFEQLGDGYYNFWWDTQDGSVFKLTKIHITTAIAEIMVFSKLKSEQLFFMEKPSMAIGESGLIDI